MCEQLQIWKQVIFKVLIQNIWGQGDIKLAFPEKSIVNNLFMEFGEICDYPLKGKLSKILRWKNEYTCINHQLPVSSVHQMSEIVISICVWFSTFQISKQYFLS